MAIARISDKGQVTLPVEIRRELGLKAKSQVTLDVRDGEVVLRPVKSVRELYGVFARATKDKPADWDAEREAMYRAVADEYRKKLER